MITTSSYEILIMNCLWLTQIYLYCFYIPELIWIANGMETNPGPPVVVNIDASKTIRTPFS